MAQVAPQSVDVNEIQLKTQSKYKIFGGISKLRDHISLLAVASNAGLLFVGNPYNPELQALILQDVLYAKEAGKNVHLRKVTLPSVPNAISCSTDGSMLAVNYSFHNFGVLDIYQVASFAIGEPKLLYSIRLPSESAVALQLLWNPVLPNVIGVVLSNGDLGVYTLKEEGTIEMCTLQNQQVKCGCWSPKGKQIVLGFPGGKLQQFKPDLTPAKSINCPSDVHPGNFDVIAVHWLSTFQFIVCFLQNVEEALPSFYIVNVPKGSNPTYISYNDICYSSPGPRAQQVQFTHISQWNLLLVTSANGVEVGILGSKDANDLPTWIHYMLPDEARIELPLTDSSDETYPMGLVLDTSSMHQLTVGEQKLETMPMVHVLSTHGDLLSFNFLNLTPNAANICSPPPPINFELEKFTILVEEEITNQDNAHTSSSSIEKLEEKPVVNTSIPAAVPPPTTFNIQPNNFQSSTPFRTQPMLQTNVQKFEVFESNNRFLTNELKNKITESLTKVELPAQSTEHFKPLYTVSPVFAAPAKDIGINQQVQKESNVLLSEPTATTKTHNLNMVEANNVIQQMISLQILSFDKEVKQLNSNLNLSIDEDINMLKSYSLRLANLQDVTDQAKNRSFIIDVQDLRQSLTESYEMLSECRTKLEAYKNPEEIGIKRLNVFDCISQRQLNNLRRYLAINHAIMRKLEEEIDSQWSYYQDLVRRNSKTHTRIPYLDGIYQQMTKLKKLLTEQQTKLSYIKSVLKQNNMNYKSTEDYCKRKLGADNKFTIDSITDSILSLSLSRVGNVRSSKLSTEKLNAIRNFCTQQGQVKRIKPQRPYRKELTSEVILESKISIKKDCKDSKEIASKPSTVDENNLGKISSQPKPTDSVKALPNFANVQKPAVAPLKSKENTIFGQNVPTFSGFNLANNNLFPNVAPINKNSQEVVKSFANTSLEENKTKSSNQITTSNLEEKNILFSKSDDRDKPKDSTNALSSFATNLAEAAAVTKKIEINLLKPQQFGNNLNDVSKNFELSKAYGGTSVNSGEDSKASFVLPANSSVSQPISFNLNTTTLPNFEKKFEPKQTNLFSGTGTLANVINSSQSKPITKLDEQPKDLQPGNINVLSSQKKEAEDVILSSLNICKPTTKAADVTAQNVTSALNAFSFKLDDGNNIQNVKTANTLPTASAATANVTSPTSTTPTASESPSQKATQVSVSSSPSFMSISASPAPSTVSISSAPVSGSSTTLPGEKSFSFVGAAGFQLPSFSSVNPTTTAVTTTQNPITIQTTAAASAFLPTSTANTAPVASFGGESKEPLKTMFAGAASGIVPSTTSSSIFASAATNSTDLSGNLFGNSSSFNSSTGGSIFGRTATSPTATSSIFGNSAVKNAESPATNLFGSPTQPNTTTGGSLFNQSTFGQPSANAFSPPAATSMPSAAPTASNFSFTGSLFGNATTGISTSGGSLFGGGAQRPAETQPFGAPAFNANPTMGATSPFSAFSQGTSVATTGFGSPTQQANTSFGTPTPQVNAFSKPVFGGAPAFGGSPLFGSQPSFGGAPTFGSPKGFGTFSAPNPPQFGSPAQNSNIFEALGSTDTGLSFGNLAQSTNTAQPPPKPIFGGSSFQNYRT